MRLRANVASCTPRFTATVVVPTPPFAPITTMSLSCEGKSLVCRSSRTRSSRSFNESVSTGLPRKSCTPLRIASSNKLGCGGTAAEHAINFTAGLMRRSWLAKTKKGSGSRAKSRNTTSGIWSAESGKRSVGTTHCTTDEIRPVCSSPASNCAELVRSLLAIAAVNI